MGHLRMVVHLPLVLLLLQRDSCYSSNADCQAPPSKKSKNLTTLPTMPAIEGNQALKSHEASSVYESASTPSASSSAAGTQDDEVCTLKSKCLISQTQPVSEVRASLT